VSVSFLLSVSATRSLALCRFPKTRWQHIDELNFTRSVQGLTSVLLALRQKPFIRYAVHSEAAQLFARALDSTMKSEKELFDFRRRETGSPLLVRAACCVLRVALGCCVGRIVLGWLCAGRV